MGKKTIYINKETEKNLKLIKEDDKKFKLSQIVEKVLKQMANDIKNDIKIINGLKEVRTATKGRKN